MGQSAGPAILSGAALGRGVVPQERRHGGPALNQEG